MADTHSDAAFSFICKARGRKDPMTAKGKYAIQIAVEKYLINTFEDRQRGLFETTRHTVKTNYPIKVWAINKKVDVALLADDKLIAIALIKELEQNKANEIDNLKENLIKKYLIGTEIGLGIFASSPEPDKWQYYKRSGKREPIEITRDHFETQVLDTHSTVKPTPNPIDQQGIARIVNHPSTETVKTEKQPTKPIPDKQTTQSHQQTPKTENEIREIVKKDLQLITSLSRIEKTDFVPRWEFKKEHTIRFGRERTGREDLALLLNQSPFVIVECKRQGINEKDTDTNKSTTRRKEEHRNTMGCAAVGWILLAITIIVIIASINS